MEKSVTLLKKKKITEYGRTMLETLSVLAVMGVLSVGGVAGYKTAMERYKANNLMHEVTLRAATVSSSMMLGLAPTLSEYSQNSDYVDGINFSIGKPSKFSTPPGPDDWQFAIIMDGVPKNVCKRVFGIVGSGGNNQTIRSLQSRERSPMTSANDCYESAKMAVVYNRDLSTKKLLNSINNPEECEANNAYWCEDAGNGVSACLSNPSDCCSDVSCDEGQTCRKGQCVDCVESELDNGQIVCMAEGDTADCVGGYGTPYCVQCTAEQGPAHCSGYSDSDSYRDYEHTPCVCGNNYDCSSHSCVSCPQDQTPVCANEVYWTTPGGGCTCVYSDEDAQCTDYSQCAFCGPGETSVCSGAGCTCIKDGETADCIDGYESCGCGSLTSDVCTVCPEGQKAICPGYVDNCMWCYSSVSSGCKCVPENEESACIDYYYGEGDACISCPSDKKARCWTSGGYYEPPESKCECLDESEEIICAGEYGDLCKKCATGQELKCPQYSHDVSECICVDAGTTNAECTKGGDYCSCYENHGECIVCEEGETAYCTQAEETCCEGEQSGDCICVPNDKTGYCSQKQCIFCEVDETPGCNEDGSICICLPAGKEAVCNETMCLPCDPGRMLDCSDGVCSCGNMACNNSGDCIECSDDQTPVCAKYGSCVCVDNNQQYECNDYNCTVCTNPQQIKIPFVRGAGVCIDTNENADCSSTECIKCSEPQTADCSYLGSCQCLNATVGQSCTVNDDCTGLCEVCSNGTCTTDCANCVGEIETQWSQPKLTSNGTFGVSAFATQASSEIDSNRKAWRAFDKINSNPEIDCWHTREESNKWLSWYTKTPTKIISIVIHNRIYGSGGVGNLGVADFELQYSDNNSNWITVATGTNPSNESGASYTVSVNSPTAHSYWRLKVLSSWSVSGTKSSSIHVAVGELDIRATEVVTSSYREDPITHKCIKN